MPGLAFPETDRRDYLAQQMDNYFFGSGADVAAGYTPPLQK